MNRRLADPILRQQACAELAGGWYGGIPWDWERVVVSRCSNDQQIVGQSVQRLAEVAKVEPAEYALRLCEQHGNRVQVVLFYRTEADMLTFLRHELASVGSDGSAIALAQGGNRPHPRFYGAFPRILGRYVRDQQALSLQQAIRKMTVEPATRLGLSDRGLLQTGMVADLVLFDPTRVIDHATYTDPCQAPSGIDYVLVNGQIVVDQARQTSARPGRVLLKH
jgi:N-acyl-D-aspartate/D-glutamate deacylase